MDVMRALTEEVLSLVEAAHELRGALRKGEMPIVMYHGTPDASFDRFHDDQFFTPDPDYARRFLSSATSSSSFYGVKDRRPGIFTALIRARNPFDTRDPAHRALLRERFCGIHGEGILTGLGLPDWVEGRDIALWLREELPDLGFDAVLVDEGRDEAGQRPPSWIVFSGDQIQILHLIEHGPSGPELMVSEHLSTPPPFEEDDLGPN